MQTLITRVIDFFYPPFKKFMPVRFFRYLACGGFNVLLDWTLFFIFYNFILQKQVVDLGFIAFKPHIAAFLITFPITFFIGFYLSRNISFSGSQIHGKVQLFRYLIVAFSCLLINYICLKTFVDWMGIWPLPSKMITTIFTTIFSYLTQKHYTFQPHKNKSADSF